MTPPVQTPDRNGGGALARCLLGLLVVIALAAGGCASGESTTVSDSPDRWIEVFCDGLADVSARAFDESASTEQEPEAAMAQWYGEVLADADAAGGGPPEQFVEDIDALRAQVDSGRVGMNALGGDSSAICNPVFAKYVAEPRFVLSEAPDGFDVCSANDFDMLGEMMESAGAPASNQVSLWSESGETEPLAGISALIESPPLATIDIAEGTEPAVAVNPDESTDVWHVTVTFPTGIRTEPSDVPSAMMTGPDGIDVGAQVNGGDAVFELTIAGTDESTAAEIAESVSVGGGQLVVGFEGLEPLIKPTAMSQLPTTGWNIEAASADGRLSIDPSDLTAHDAELLAKFREQVGGEVRSLDADVNPLPVTERPEWNEFPPTSIDVNGRPAFVTGGSAGGVLYQDLDATTIKVTLRGGTGSQEALIATLGDAAGKVTPATSPEEWLDYGTSLAGSALDAASPCFRESP